MPKLSAPDWVTKLGTLLAIYGVLFVFLNLMGLNGHATELDADNIKNSDRFVHFCDRLLGNEVPLEWQSRKYFLSITPAIFLVRTTDDQSDSATWVERGRSLTEKQAIEILRYIRRDELHTYSAGELDRFLKERFKKPYAAPFGMTWAPLEIERNLLNGLLSLRGYDLEHRTSFATEAGFELIRKRKIFDSESGDWVYHWMTLYIAEDRTPDGLQRLLRALRSSPSANGFYRLESAGKWLKDMMAKVRAGRLNKPDRDDLAFVLRRLIDWQAEWADQTRSFRSTRLGQGWSIAKAATAYFEVEPETHELAREFFDRMNDLDRQISGRPGHEALLLAFEYRLLQILLAQPAAVGESTWLGQSFSYKVTTMKIGDVEGRALRVQDYLETQESPISDFVSTLITIARHNGFQFLVFKNVQSPTLRQWLLQNDFVTLGIQSKNNFDLVLEIK